MHELMAALNADKFATFWMLPTSFYYSFVLQMTFIHSTIGLTRFRKKHENMLISKTQC